MFHGSEAVQGQSKQAQEVVDPGTRKEEVEFVFGGGSSRTAGPLLVSFGFIFCDALLCFVQRRWRPAALLAHRYLRGPGGGKAGRLGGGGLSCTCLWRFAPGNLDGSYCDWSESGGYSTRPLCGLGRKGATGQRGTTMRWR